MNKTEFVKEISKQSKLTQKDCNSCLKAITMIIQNSLKKGEDINLVGFGKFEVKHRMERRGYNPQTKKISIIPASKTPNFKPGKTLKSVVGLL